MAAPQRGQCQRVELSEGIWQIPVSARPEGAGGQQLLAQRQARDAQAIRQKPEVKEAQIVIEQWRGVQQQETALGARLYAACPGGL